VRWLVVRRLRMRWDLGSGSCSPGKGVVILTNAYPGNGKPVIQELFKSVDMVTFKFVQVPF
jgi:hypothetical protein